jgi:hypothetical protein
VYIFVRQDGLCDETSLPMTFGDGHRDPLGAHLDHRDGNSQNYDHGNLHFIAAGPNLRKSNSSQRDFHKSSRPRVLAKQMSERGAEYQLVREARIQQFPPELRTQFHVSAIEALLARKDEWYEPWMSAELEAGTSARTLLLVVGGAAVLATGVLIATKKRVA